MTHADASFTSLVLLNTSAHRLTLVPPAILQYRNPWGHARIGRLLEDLDSLAGNVAFLHWYINCVKHQINLT